MNDPATQPDPAPAQAEPTGAKPIRIQLKDNYDQVGYWYLRADEGKWTCTEKLPGFDHSLREGAELKDGITTLVSAIIAFFLVRDEQFRETEKLIEAAPERFERKGFRPGYGKKRLIKMRADYGKMQAEYTRTVNDLVAQAQRMGWPAPVLAELPWKA